MTFLANSFLHRGAFELVDGVILGLDHFDAFHEFMCHFERFLLQLSVFFLESFSLCFPMLRFLLHLGLDSFKLGTPAAVLLENLFGLLQCGVLLA